MRNNEALRKARTGSGRGAGAALEEPNIGRRGRVGRRQDALEEHVDGLAAGVIADAGVAQWCIVDGALGVCGVGDRAFVREREVIACVPAVERRRVDRRDAGGQGAQQQRERKTDAHHLEQNGEWATAAKPIGDSQEVQSMAHSGPIRLWAHLNP